jgi:BirA family biotin operon repressor/biotin-[acetyl-CoA-carboxylase] ligase
MSAGDLTAERIGSALRTTRYGRSLDVRAVTGSTNDDARGAAERGAADGHVVVADAQTSGRGRHGHAWSSPPGTDLYFSIVARPGLAVRDLPPLTLAAGVAVAETVDAHAGTRALVKWPNDVWIGGRKVAGILVETATRDGATGPVVIGVGLDVNRHEWPEELRDVAISLASVWGEPLDRAAVLADCLLAIETWVDRLVASGPAPVIDAVERRLALRDERVRVDDAEGELLGLAPSGAVRIQTAAGVRELAAGTLAPA